MMDSVVIRRRLCHGDDRKSTWDKTMKCVFDNALVVRIFKALVVKLQVWKKKKPLAVVPMLTKQDLAYHRALT